MDTIIALGTPRGYSALALIRLSGSGVFELAQALFLKEQIKNRMAQYGEYTDVNGNKLDTVIFTFFNRPATYTGDDILEITPHGNPLIVQLILEDCIRRGCRMAEPGEFTRRAFINGKLDLAQAESVMDVISAKSELALKAAQRQLSGQVGAVVDALTGRLLKVIAHLEAYIDFPEEDLPPEGESGPLFELLALERDIGQLMATSHYRSVLHEGLSMVIIGSPNVGKSSLMNSLLGQKRSIVSDLPGTTRDYIEDRLVIGGHLIRAIDTAGIRPSESSVELMGIEKSIEQLANAELIIHVWDSTEEPPVLDPSIGKYINPDNAIIVINKVDLNSQFTVPQSYAQYAVCRMSAISGAGVEGLRGEIVRWIAKTYPSSSGDGVIISARHSAALAEVNSNVANAILRLRDGAFAELVACDLRLALDSMGVITGKIDNEKVLDQLFGEFCIGK
jgi:tRNA modification GTPase